jgi:hypothetical protein
VVCLKVQSQRSLGEIWDIKLCHDRGNPAGIQTVYSPDGGPEYYRSTSLADSNIDSDSIRVVSLNFLEHVSIPARLFSTIF